MTSPSTADQTSQATGFSPHDHQACVADALAVAEAHCAAHDLRFTPVRRRVLEILLQEHKALGAYALLDKLRAEGLGSQPPVAYRALDFLVSHGFAHKIQRLNAFVACTHSGADHAPVFMICRSCESVAEAHVHQDNDALSAAAAASGFVIEQTVVEAEGVCPKCLEPDPA